MVNQFIYQLLNDFKSKYSHKRVIQVIYGIFTFIRDEIKLGLSVYLPFHKRLEMYKKGFRSWDYYILDLENNDPKYYLSTFTQKAFATVNDNPELTRNKNIFHNLMIERGLKKFRPKVFGEIKNGMWSLKEYENFQELLFKEKKLVFKPVFGGGGEGVFICKIVGQDLIVNGKQTTIHKFKNKIQKYNHYMIEEFIEQANFLKKIYPDSANTLRVHFINPENKEPYFPAIALRIGRERSGNLDNFSAGKGGLSAIVDINEGRLGKAGSGSESGRPCFFNRHPDTGSKIKGTTIPGWGKIKNDLKKILKELPELKYGEFDVLLTGEGNMIILEANCNPGCFPIQIHRPLLKDDRLREFYLHHDVPIKE